ncbi:outer membrane beta-barrel family protein [Seonamhaeicola maritimus]|uniref:outer membrane beta-barrel family protein n=1 Tax=Seonamhaeicola maritimus TaxID=2591822 RepID=UPI002494A9BB|nr:outer membrane beta-barrel family protein [Seonamhaeicola maritimus]
MFKVFLALSIFLTSLNCFAQDLVLQGHVFDEKNTPVPFANVVLLSVDGNDIISGTTTNEEGAFIFEVLSKSKYILKVTFLGFKPFSEEIDLNLTPKFQNIILKENIEAIEGVTVVAKKPTVRRMVDRLVFNVENSTLSNNNVLDMLKHTPGVLVHDGAITIKNSRPTIYINGRKIHLSSEEVQQLLEGTSGGNIKSIEVITNPPAIYEAEGRTVLNLVTSKNIVAGYNGSVFGNYKQGSEYPKYSYGTSHFFKTKKLNTYVNFSDNPKKEYRNNKEYINFFENDQIKTTWKTDYIRTRKTSNKSINANIDYEIDEKNSLGFSTNIIIAPRSSTKTFVNSTTEVFNNNKILDSSFVTDNRLVDETFNLAFTLDYKHKFKREGEHLFFSAHHTNYDFSSFQNVDTNYLFPDKSLIRDNRFQTFSSQVIRVNTGQIDYYLSLNESFQFEAGAKVSSIESENILNQFIFLDGIKEEDFDNSDKFSYDETNYAAYLSFSKDWEDVSLKIGLRGEYTRAIGNSIPINNVNINDYLKLFPSFYLMYHLNENDNIYLRFNKRINRPRYITLNPFKYYLTDNSFLKGNPELRPHIDDVITLGYTFNKDYTFELYFRNEKDYITQIVSQDNEFNLIKYIFSNTDAITYGIDFNTYTLLARNWNLYVLASTFYYKNKVSTLETNNRLYTIDKWSIYGQVINYFNFLRDKSLTMDVSYLYISPVIEGPTAIRARHGLDINLRKSFWDNRASLNIGLSDVFNTKNERLSTRYFDQDIMQNTMIENRMLILGFNYKFGNYKLTNNKKAIENTERERLH